MRFWYRLRNWRSELRMLLIDAGVLLARMCGLCTVYGDLSAVHITADGVRTDLGVIGKMQVTDAGVAFLVDDWDGGANDFSLFNFHDSGTGVVGEAAGDVALGTPAGPARVSGTKSQPSANIMRTVATITYTATLAITEHGLFSASSGVTLWDRTVFGAINVVNTDSIQFTYDGTFPAGS